MAELPADLVKAWRWELGLAVVRDLQVARPPTTPEDLEALETDVLARFVLARAAAGLCNSTAATTARYDRRP
ncbi:hypothetical protein [Microtetraspora malaysiensis]|uniref:Uncharacterized protein n=1 Tax=Microtetraspora malaysiensis TaxID=161358 RepID=A0ABW6SQE1_9ACTN